MKSPLNFTVIGKCSVSKARASVLELPHALVNTPVFMPVGTKGSLKGLLPEQVEETGCRMMLGNTYHLANKPGEQLIDSVGGLHNFMKWKHGLLTDSGGFQMVSLSKLACITEEGVTFQRLSDDGEDKEIHLSPEGCMEVQNNIGADIMMQLDHVVHSSTRGPIVEEAMHRTLRWIDRCLKANKKPESQSIFPIVQGGLDPVLRKQCAQELSKRDARGFAIGGLSGGEEKADFWRMVTLSTDYLPHHKPRYLMGVGFALDLVVCVALGCDMFDCVFPTRTARFGVALVPWGQLHLKNNKFKNDFEKLDPTCPCSTCQKYTRAYLHTIVTHESVACSLLTIHNVTYQMRLMNEMRNSILEDKFPAFVNNFMKNIYPKGDYPDWAVEALESVGIHLNGVKEQSSQQ